MPDKTAGEPYVLRFGLGRRAQASGMIGNILFGFSIFTCMLIQCNIAAEPSDAAPMVPGSDGRQWHHPPPPPPPPPVHGHGVLQQVPVTPHQPTWQITGPLGAPSDALQGTVQHVHQGQDAPPPNYTVAPQQGHPSGQHGVQIPWQPHQGIARG